MHRLSTTSRASDEFLINLPPALKLADTDKPQTSSPTSDANKKENSSPSKSPRENVIHLIPLLLILCALLLWIFSYPVDSTKGSGSLQK
ncbi:hypothetical protein Syun_011039 [Stephania yunnanensis]|uniref:Uncharacterized protein n=1 Tax=Stephania yunnanensis TaxID=152371 RepID=A0AAP0PG45_9MAGN